VSRVDQRASRHVHAFHDEVDKYHSCEKLKGFETATQTQFLFGT
jgi:hypothetical protein